MPTRGCLLVFGAAVAAAFVASLVPGSASRAGVIGSPHDFTPSNSLYSLAPLGPAGACSICHVPHNARYGGLWPRNLGNYDNALLMNGGGGTLSDLPSYLRPTTVQCYDCHDAHLTSVKVDDDPIFNSFASSHKPQNVAFGFTKGGSTDSGSTMREDAPAGLVPGYYENSPPFDNIPQTYYGADARSNSPFRRNLLDNATLGRTGGHFFKSTDPNASRGIYKGDKLPCSDCHDPHAWDSVNKNWQAFFRPRALYGYPSRSARWSQIFGAGNPTASTYMANPVLSGGSARNDGESRRMCILCHGDSASYDSVTFNDINPDYSSSTKIVRPPTTIAEHAGFGGSACVSCHEHNTIGANCSQCHGFPPSDTAAPRYPTTATSWFHPAPDPGAADSHARHYGAKSGQTRNAAPGAIYQFDCNTCHYGSALGVDSSLAHHQNSRVSVVLQGAWTRSPNGPAGVYDNMNYYNPAYPAGPRGQLDNSTGSGGWAYGTRSGWNTCTNVYCHSNGRDRSVMADADYDNVAWNSGARRCNGCHGRTTPDNVLRTGMPDYPNGGPGPAANSHQAHVVKKSIGCAVCHADTTSDAGYATGRSILGTIPTLHVNGIRNVRLSGVGPSASYDNNTKTCSNVTCHPTAVVWGTSLSCAACHVGAGDADDFGNGTGPASMTGNGITARIDNTEWMWSGHGATPASHTGGQYEISLNPVANLLGGGGTGTNTCAFCHDPVVNHDNTANPFRLANYNVFAQEWNGACYVCHAAAPVGNSAPGYAPATDNSGTYIAKTAVSKVGSNHYTPGNATNARHSSTYNGGKFCWDCHDPHGDRTSGGGNIFMVGSRVSMRTDNTFGLPVASAQGDNTYRPAPVFTGNAGGANYVSTDNAAPYDGICEVCHQGSSGVLHYVNTGRLDSTHFTSKCTVCHTHDAGFRGLGGPDVEQYFDNAYNAASATPGQENYDDRSRHPLTIGTTSASLLFGGAENCLGCHGAKYKSSGVEHWSNECLKCHFEHVSGSNPALDATRHMNRVIELSTITGNGLPGSQYPIGTLAQYDSWCLQCHGGTTITLGGVAPSGKTVIDPAAFANGRHRTRSVGCIYCHQPHGRTNTRIVRENPDNRRARGVGPFMFGVYPNDNTGSYGAAVPNQALNYRSRVDATYADAADENGYCNVACHIARLDNNYMKDKLIRRDNITGNYLLAPDNNKVFIVNGVEYTKASLSTTMHVHPNGEIIATDDMVDYYKAASGLTGPSRYRYPASGNANPNTFINATSPLPFFPDYGPDNDRTFSNAYNNTGWLLKYRFTCSTCHNPHGTTLPNTAGGSGYPDLREPKSTPDTLCLECHR